LRTKATHGIVGLTVS